MDYSRLTSSELKDLCRGRMLLVTGNKQAMVKRLETWDSREIEILNPSLMMEFYYNLLEDGCAVLKLDLSNETNLEILHLFQLIQENKTLQQLEVSKMKYFQFSAFCVTALKDISITHLTLTGVNMRGPFSVFYRAFKTNRNENLKILELNGCNLGDTELSSLSELIMHYFALEVLHLKNNDNTNRGAEQILYSLQQAPNLVELSLTLGQYSSARDTEYASLYNQFENIKKFDFDEAKTGTWKILDRCVYRREYGIPNMLVLSSAYDIKRLNVNSSFKKFPVDVRRLVGEILI